jgi:plasmid maintenance system antidote protein VapI
MTACILRDHSFPRLGWSLEEAAEKLGVSAEFLTDLFEGRAKISMSFDKVLTEKVGGTYGSWQGMDKTPDEMRRHMLNHRQPYPSDEVLAL